VGNPDLLATITQVAVWVLAVVIALGQLGIAATVVNALIIGVVGAVALASGLAFGLGGRDRAARLLDRWAEPPYRAPPRAEPTADSPVLIEEYVEGREMYVGVIGNDNPAPLPVVELDLSKLPEGRPRIAGAEVKWGKGTRAYRDTKSAVAEDLPEETVTLLQQTAVAVFQALELRDYARIDMRLRPDGRVAVIEANPNPWLASKAEFAMAARKSGRNYTQLIEELVELAMARYGTAP